MARERGRGRRGDRCEDTDLHERLMLHEQLKREREEISELKQHAYKSALWALRMDHQKINWRLELAIGEIKKTLNITQEVHNKIVQELDKEFSEAADEANRSAEANRKVVEDKGVAPTSKITSPKKKKTSEDEGDDSRAYDGNIVGKTANIKWAGDGKFKEVVVIDYDMENGKHFLHHVNEKLYEWLDLNELFPEDIRWDHSRGSGREFQGGRGAGRGGRGRGSGRGGRGFNQGIGESSLANSKRADHGGDEIELYDMKQLGNMVMKVLQAPTPTLLKEAEEHLEKQRRYLNIGLRTVARKAATVGAQVPAKNPSVRDDDGGQGGDVHGGDVHGGGGVDGSDDGNESGDDENNSVDVGDPSNFDDEKKSGDEDKPGSIGRGSGRSRNSGAASGSKRTGNSSSSSGRSSSSGTDSRSSSGNSGHTGNGTGNNSDSDE